MSQEWTDREKAIVTAIATTLHLVRIDKASVAWYEEQASKSAPGSARLRHFTSKLKEGQSSLQSEIERLHGHQADLHWHRTLPTVLLALRVLQARHGHLALPNVLCDHILTFLH